MNPASLSTARMVMLYRRRGVLPCPPADLRCVLPAAPGRLYEVLEIGGSPRSRVVVNGAQQIGEPPEALKRWLDGPRTDRRVSSPPRLHRGKLTVRHVLGVEDSTSTRRGPTNGRGRRGRRGASIATRPARGWRRCWQRRGARVDRAEISSRRLPRSLRRVDFESACISALTRWGSSSGRCHRKTNNRVL